jgi:hypothetical protein
MEKGELPHDFELIGGLVQDVCYNNARDMIWPERRGEVVK